MQVSEAGRVAAHYDGKRALGVAQRNASPIIHLRHFNNWVKAVLLEKHWRSGAVLDLCCGMGGDLGKYARMGVRRVVGVDISEASLQEAARRLGGLHAPAMQCTFVPADACAVDLGALLPRDVQFTLVSCQFALHYAFESEARARQFLANVASRLLPGGYFVGTTTNVARILERAAAGPAFGNSVFSITFDDGIKFDDKQPPPGSPFGRRLRFSLVGAVDDCPEYLVDAPALCALASAVGLQLQSMLPFHDFYSQHTTHHALLRSMQRGSRGMTPDEWEAIGLYSAFVFRKVEATVELS